MAQVIKTAKVVWTWSGDIDAVKGFNVCITKDGDSPLNASLVFARTGRDLYEHTFRNVVFDNQTNYVGWVQAFYDGDDSEWRSSGGVLYPDDGINTLETRGNVDGRIHDVNEDIANQARALNPNWNFDLEDAYGKPVGVHATDGSTDRSIISFNDALKAELRLYSSTDSTIGFTSGAFATKQRYKYRVIARIKSGISLGSGFSLTAYESDTELASGKIAIGSPDAFGSHTVVQPANRRGIVASNLTLATSYQDFSFEYAPGAGTKWMSVGGALTSTAFTSIIIDFIRVSEIPPENLEELDPAAHEQLNTSIGPDGLIKPGAVNITQFASGIAPVGLVTALPDPTGYDGPSVVFNTADGKLYRLVGGQWTAGVPSTDFVGQLVGSQIADAAITAAKLASDAVTAASFASGITPVEIVGALPTSGNFVGRIVLLTTDGKLYRFDGSSFVSTIAAVDIVGQIDTTQVADGAITAAKIEAGAISSTKLASGIKAVEIVSTLPTTGNTAGRIVFLTTDNKLYRYNGTGWSASVAAVDISGQVVAGQIADGAITASKLAGSVVDSTKLASSIKAVEIVSTLPTTGNTEGRVVFLTTDGKLYRYTSGAWSSAVAAVDISGQVVAGQIADGAITASKLAGSVVDSTKLASSIKAVEIVSTLPTTGNTAGRVVFLTTDNKLYRYTGTSWTTSVATSDLSGTVSTTQIADSAITAAKLASSIIDATKLASGIKAVEIVSTLPTAGNSTGRIVFLTTDNKLYRYNGTGWTASVPTSDLSGTIESAQVTDGAITASKIGVSAVTAEKIVDGAVTAAKLAGNAVDSTKLASGIKAVEIVSTLPTAGNSTGRIVFLTTDSKLYRFTGSEWTTVVEAVDIDSRGLDIKDQFGETIFGSDGKISQSAYLNLNGTVIALSEVAGNALTPALHYVGDFAEAPTAAQLGENYKQNAIYKNTTDGRSYVLTGTPLGWVIYLESGTSFILSIESTNGTTFRPGYAQNTILKARLFKNGAEVTEQTPFGWFRWRRVSGVPLSPPNDDVTWNGLYQSGYKQVAVNVDDVHARATFFCDIISP